ncbi:uncharacterized protein I303_100559 [Kwoniella dejecticola CBS 10117]|uniref:Uncharacterized protein n=1 Tax=Kwoniella dejecticola CBS 10117 TaxID=1296121 RepID=A0AAJ8MDS2_9TREE
MLASTHRHKRPRSPSPPLSPDLASPLDIILKRRRREDLSFSSPGELPASPFAPHQTDYFGSLPFSNGNGGEQELDLPHAESSTSALKRSMAGVERRRTKQWERQNAPSVSHSQPTPPHSNRYLNVTPTPRNAHSQPDPMSSSPIRNVLPSSSPFRPKPMLHDNDMWHITSDNDEMKREWGEAYEKQNWLLHSLHLARLRSQSHQHQHQHTHTHDGHLAQQSHSPLRPTDSTSSNDTMSSQDSTLVSPHPAYRNHPSYPDSSPFNSHHPSVELRSPSYGNDLGHHMDDEDMEMLNPHLGTSDAMEDEIRKRYEETNRLLGELEVVRRTRWG